MSTGASIRRLALALLLGVAGPAGATTPPQPDLAGLRALYVAAVDDAAAIEAGLAEVARLRADGAPLRGSWAHGTLIAYEGALVTLRAKHALWPPAKLRHLRDGLATLDALVAAQPDHAEARYLRLMSCYYLPAFLGRGWSVREDFRELARLLPGERSRYPAKVYDGIVAFLLAEGDPAVEQRRRLEASLGESHE